MTWFERPRRVAEHRKKGKTKEDKKQEAADQLLEVLQSIEQDYDTVWGSAPEAGRSPRVSRIQRRLLRLHKFLPVTPGHRSQGLDRA